MIGGAALTRLGMALRASVVGADSLELAADRVALAALLDGQGRDDEAERLCLDALACYKGTGAADRADVAAALNNLGALYARRGRLDQATDLLEQAAALKREALGREHPDLAVTLNNLAVTWRRRGCPERAAALFEEAAGILEHSLGAEHPRTLICRGNASRWPGPAGRHSDGGYPGQPTAGCSNSPRTDADGSNLSRLTDDPASDVYPAFSRDGRLVSASDRSRDWDIDLLGWPARCAR